jgi:hypothetical protein
VLESRLRYSESAAVAGQVNQEILQDSFLASASFHQPPFRAPTIIVCTGNNQLFLVELDHLVAERVQSLGFVGLVVWTRRTAVAIPIRKEHKVEWIDFEGLVVFQTNISHCRKWDSDAAVDIVHELLKLKPVSRIGAEISTLENVQWSTLPGRDACK